MKRINTAAIGMLRLIEIRKEGLDYASGIYRRAGETVKNNGIRGCT